MLSEDDPFQRDVLANMNLARTSKRLVFNQNFWDDIKYEARGQSKDNLKLGRISVLKRSTIFRNINNRVVQDFIQSKITDMNDYIIKYRHSHVEEIL